MQKNNIRMVVQFPNETAKEFAKRLETICYDLSIEHKDKLNVPPTVLLTSAGDGRQTATLQFITAETDKTKEPLFNGSYLRLAYIKFQSEVSLRTEQSDALIKFLLKQVVDDYIDQ